MGEREGWLLTDDAPEGVVVETKIDDEHGARNHQRLKRQGRLWWHPDGSMYVYYRPTHWRPSFASFLDGGNIVIEPALKRRAAILAAETSTDGVGVPPPSPLAAEGKSEGADV